MQYSFWLKGLTTHSDKVVMWHALCKNGSYAMTIAIKKAGVCCSYEEVLYHFLFYIMCYTAFDVLIENLEV